ncbi:tetratricopeptide repeat protein [compost metagenome]
MSNGKVVHAIEKMIIPTYVPPAPEEMPMYSEFRQHQGSTGYAYPNKVTIGVERNTLTEKEYTVVRLENDYIRLLILPELGGRILEGYDKTSNYHFLYRHTRIKPVIVGSYGSWISGGMEFNFPFHHRPSTFMPVDFTVEECEGGSTIVWLSEAAPSPGQFRLKGTFGIKLRKDASYLETIVKIDNRTPMKHPFMWWENAGIHVNEDYQLFFPQDVGYVHHHNDRHHASFPITKGWYAVENHKEETDISIHKNTIKGNSFFAGPSKYDFFGGYDHQKDCGTVHFADHHITPGKKMFQWALEDLGDAWNSNLTDTDGEHAELMAGSFADDQPDFTYIAPYEVKCFSQYWYPIHKVKVPVFANLHAVVSLDKAASKARIAVTTSVENAVFTISCNGTTVLSESISLLPSDCKEFEVSLGQESYTIQLTDNNGILLLEYTEDVPDVLRIPEDNTGVPTPNQLKTAQDIFLAGQHLDQYRDPSWKGSEYYKVALDRQSDYIPALLAMAEVSYNNALYEEGLEYIARAEKVQNKYNQNPYDGTSSYLKALCLYGLQKYDSAYEVFHKASWSFNTISPALTFISAIDGRRKDYVKMKEYALTALKKEAEHAICQSYLAVAEYKLGNEEAAIQLLKEIIAKDKLDHLARYLYAHYTKSDLGGFYALLNSNPSQTCLDIAFNLLDAGLAEEVAALLEGLKAYSSMSTMAHYTLAYTYEQLGEPSKAEVNRNVVKDKPYVDTFPYRLEEIEVLKAAVSADNNDYTAVYLLGCIQYDKTHYEQAAVCFRKAIEIKPDFYIPYRNLAVVYYSKFGRHSEALELLKKACSINPKDDVLVKETNYVMAKLGVDGKERLEFLLNNIPSAPSDNITWDLADAYSNIFEYQQAIDTLLNHEFVAAECQETYLTEAYTFALCAKGRLLRKEGKLAEALQCFKQAQVIPANFRAGWWDTQALYYAVYFEAEALLLLGQENEARQVASNLIPFIHSGYSPYMGPETDYYVALAHRLLGDEVVAKNHISKYVVEWEKDSKCDLDRKPIVTSLYWSYVPDAVKTHKATIIAALGYSRLFFNDPAGAKNYFQQSLELDPDNIKVKFELLMLENHPGMK